MAKTESMTGTRTQAEWLERAHHQAAGSMQEGLDETFTIIRPGLSPQLCKCLATTNEIESLLLAVAGRARRVIRWRSAEMVLRWAATLETGRSFRKLIGTCGC